MSRRVDEVSGRCEVGTSLAGLSQAPGGLPAGVGLTTAGFVRGPAVTGVQAVPRQSVAAVATATIPSAVAAVPVATTTSTLQAGPATPDHQPNPSSQPGSVYAGYTCAKVDKHSGIHHTVPAYSSNMPTAPPPQGGLTSVVEGRTVGGPGGPQGGGGLVGQGGAAIPPVLQHVSAHSQVRHKMGELTSHELFQQVSGVGGATGVVHQTSAAAAAAAAAAGAVGAAAGAQQGSGQFQRLKVEDALSYLDQVKLRFGKQPQVYNDFLDIMKEFKSQSIDTPGVISRVSILFQGHPELIVGFNTFLPPGYKIEVSMSVPGQQTMVVHTPQGVQQHVTSTHQPQLPPAVTVKPPQRLQPPRSNLSAAGTVAVQHNPGTVGAHTVHTVGPGATPPRLPTPGPPAAPGAVVGGTNQTAQSAANTQHSTNTAPQHQQREPPPPAPQLPPPPPPPQQQQPPAQPVEFNHAINYVNKIKLRFQGQPDIYKQFLDILHTYQKEQRYIKEGVSAGRTLTETEVYEKVAKLFENQEDLLQEFGQFLPDATNNTATQEAVSDFMDQYKTNLGSNKGVANDHTAVKKSAVKGSNLSSSNNLPGSGSSGNKTSPIFGHQLKRPHTTHSGSTPTHSHSHTTQPPTKKPKLNYLKDMSAAEAGKYATLSEYAFFDKVRKALRHEETYHNFLRCITLYNEEIISRLELVQLVHPFLSKFPDLLKWFKDFVGYRDGVVGSTDIIPASVAKQERISGELAMEIDYNTCKRLGASYCALPKSYPQPKCSGRTQLCREVLNDTWVSFPSWSEDSTFVTSRKTQYEEYIYRCEDERFELDVVLETNLATIRVLEGVQKKLQRMGPEEAARFRLDDSLGGNSPTIHQRAIRRIYGDKAPDIIDGLKKNPVVAVPLVLRRLKAKDEEWREAQKGFNKIWREQNEKYYLKSLDHQGITFKQNDVKTIRSKSLLNDIETLFDERHEQAEESGEVITGPHMCLQYKDKSVLDDAANLVIHHVKRQTTIHKDDKCKIKQTMRQFIPDLFFHPKHEMSDDEKDIEEEEEDDEDNQSESKGDGTSNKRELRERECKQQSYVSTPSNKRKGRLRGSDNEKENENGKKDKTKEGEGNGNGRGKVTMNGDATEEEKVSIKQEVDEKPDIKDVFTEESDDEYRLFMGNNNWYLFLRLHQILCSRLTTMYNHAVRIAAQEAKDRKDRKESTAVALRLKPKNEIAVEDYYPALLDMVKNVLDGNMESTVYEDTLREMFGIHAFTAFTLDKVVNGAVRQLQHLVCDEPCQQCTQLYLQESRKGGSGGPLASAHRRLAMEQAYQKKAEQVLQDENCFKIYTYQRDCRMTIELVDTEVEGDDDNGGGGGNSAPSSNIPSNVAEVERWSEYVERYVSCVSPEQMSPAMMSQLSRKPVFLPRNLRSWRKLTAARQRLTQQGQGDREKSSNGDGEDSKTSLVSDMEMLDNTQCKFNLASFKMVFVVNSDSYMYKKKALQRAKQSHECVSERMRRGMREWQELWCSRHVSDANHRATTEWLMGRAESLLPNRTKMVRIDNPSRAPYAPYNKYKCEMLDEGS